MTRRKQRGFIEWAIPAAATVISGLIGKSGQESANRTNVQLGREQMDFQERMSSTAYQRAVADMQKAGLNPMLAYSQGGASAPVGSMPQVQNSAAAGMSSAAQAMNTIAGIQQIQQSKAQIEKLEAETNRIKAETQEPHLYTTSWQLRNENQLRRNNLIWQQESTERERTQYTREQTEAIKTLRNLRELQLDRENMTFADQVRIKKAEAKLKELGIPLAEAEARFYGTDLGEMNPYLKQLLNIARMLNSGIGAFGR